MLTNPLSYVLSFKPFEFTTNCFGLQLVKKKKRCDWSIVTDYVSLLDKIVLKQEIMYFLSEIDIDFIIVIALI